MEKRAERAQKSTFERQKYAEYAEKTLLKLGHKIFEALKKFLPEKARVFRRKTR